MIRLSSLSIRVDKGSSLALPVLIDDGFDMNFRFDNFKSVKNNLINLNYKLAFLHEQNDIPVYVLLGVDVIQFMKNIKMVDCMKGSARDFPQAFLRLATANIFCIRTKLSQQKFMESLPNTIIMP